MDRRSWPWKRKSSEKSPGETESSDSVSSYSERYSDDQEVLKASTNNSSPNHASPEVSSNTNTSEVPETVKSLTEKLSAAILNISAKEELVKQHMKVAEDAVSGWEKAEAEVVGLKQQLEAASKKNSVLEDRIGHLDGALKESVRQLRQSREQQEHKIQEILAQKTHEWESDKIKLENQITELQVQLEAAKVETSASVNLTLQSKLEAAEKENTALKIELLARTEDLKRQTLEKELSTRAAESASKQHLEDIKKVAKLEAEFRRLQTVARRASSAHDYKPFSNSVCVESLTDSHSDSGERSLGAEHEPNSDLWASALITELDHFKSDKVSAKNLGASIEIDLMDDFLEMERLAAIQEVDRTSESNRAVMGDNPLQVELDTMRRKVADYEEKINKMETEKAELEMVLADCRNQLDLSRSQAVVAEDKLVVLQRQLDSANESKLIAMTEVVDAEEKGNQLEYQLKLSKSEVRKLHQNISILQGQVEKEKALCAEFRATLEALETARKAFECQAESANFKVVKLSEIVRTLEVQVDEEKKVSSEFKKLECQLNSADSEIKKLNEKIDILESIADEEKVISIELTAKLEASEEKRKAIECQLESAHLEIRKLHEDVIMLEGQIEEKKSLSAELAAKLEAMEAAKMAGDSQLKLADIDIGELREKVGLLEAKIEEETAFSAELVAKQRNLEVGLSKKWQEAELQQITSSNGELRVKQEKDMAMAAEKMAECQRTIASLSSQLKSLASLDDVVVEFEKTELNGALLDISNGVKKSPSPDPAARTVTSPISNGKNRGSSPSTSSPSSAFSGFAKLISLSRSSNRAEN